MHWEWLGMSKTERLVGSLALGMLTFWGLVRSRLLYNFIRKSAHGLQNLKLFGKVVFDMWSGFGVLL